MKIIYEGRCTGKTTQLIEHASKTGSLIVAGTIAEKRCIQKKVKQMYENKMITDPHICVVVPSELKDYANDTKVVVDNAEYVLQSLLGCQIDAISINKEPQLRGMTHPIIITSETPHETEQLDERLNWIKRWME